MSILLVAEHDNQMLRPSTLSTVTAAQQLNQPIDILVAGYDCARVAESAAQIQGVRRILLAAHVNYQDRLAESVTPLVLHYKDEYCYFLFPATTFGKNILPHLSAKLNISPVSDIIAVLDSCTYKRPIYAGNAIATVRTTAKQQAISVRSAAFVPAPLGEKKALIQEVAFVSENKHSRFIKLDQHAEDRPALSSARIVISGGRGLENQANFAALMRIAKRLGAAVGASRAAVDAGLVANECQVGQTGQVVAPELYIAVGISGAIQHLAGMIGSKVIVAINADPQAPIFEVADYALLADLKEILPAWEKILSTIGY